ncbi:MAG: phosphatase PAP2 family protein [Stenotrophomonas sp.]
MPASPDKALSEEAAGFSHWLRRNGWRFALLFAGVLLPLAVFVALADEIHELEAFHFDQTLLWRMHAMSSPLLDRGFVWISRLGYQWGVIPLDVLLVALVLTFRRWREGSFAAISVIGSALLNLASKPFFHRDRPGLWESIAPESSFSFPSGHAMGSMTLAATLVLLAWPTRWRWPVLALGTLFVVLVGFSRVYLGVHYPSDILGGWSAALAWVSGVYLLMFHGRAPWSKKGH